MKTKSLVFALLFVMSVGCSRKAKIIEFMDFQCPSCKMAHSMFNKLKQEFGSKLVLQIKHFPIQNIHPYAMDAAIAAECARDQGKFWQMYDELFKISPDLRKENIMSVADSIKLDIKKFLPCLDSEKKKRIIAQNLNEGKRLNISGTPSFLIENEILSGIPPYKTFRQIIQDILKGKKFNHPEVEITVINDENCPTCGTTKMVSELKKVFFNHQVHIYTSSEDKGKELMKGYHITWLPAIILSKNIKGYVNSYMFIPLRVIDAGENYLLNPSFYQIGYSKQTPTREEVTTTGPADAPIKLVHYTGFGHWCVGCFDAFKYIKNSMKGYEKHISITYKLFAPDPKNPSHLASLATLCAGEQGKFEKMFSKIHLDGFKNDYTEYAEEIGVRDIKKFKKCVEEKKYSKLLIDTTNEAIKLWVPYAPYTFVNNFRFPNIPDPNWLRGLFEDLVRLHKLGISY